MDHQSTQRQQTTLTVNLKEAREEHTATHKRLQAVLNLSHQLAESPDERSLMDAALSTLTNLVDALGCSFIPLDEWDQPLPAFTFGRLPNPVMQSWSAYQEGSVLLARCRNCTVLKSEPGGCPLHPEVLGSSISVVCLPLYQPEKRGVKTNPPRRLGILNLYLTSGKEIDPEFRAFLEALLQEIALAVQSVRMREQELSTLRQI